MERKRKILMIDDDETVLLALRKKLEGRYELVQSMEPKKAVMLALAHEPDLILCDIEMPEHNGGDVAAALAANPRTAGIPFMFLTSMVSPVEAHQLEGKVDGKPGVAKGGPLPLLLQKIEALLGSE